MVTAALGVAAAQLQRECREHKWRALRRAAGRNASWMQRIRRFAPACSSVISASRRTMSSSSSMAASSSAACVAHPPDVGESRCARAAVSVVEGW